MRKTFGTLLLLFAVGNIAYDAVSTNAMGVPAILLTVVTAVVGALLVRGKPSMASEASPV